MKLIMGLKDNRTKSHIVGVILYVLGTIFDIYGYINVGVETLAYIFHIMFVGYASALAIIWYLDNKKLLKAAKYHFLFFLIGIPIIFIAWFKQIYPTFVFTTIFICVIGILFITNLCRICSAYYYDDWR